MSSLRRGRCWIQKISLNIPFVHKFYLTYLFKIDPYFATSRSLIQRNVPPKTSRGRLALGIEVRLGILGVCRCHVHPLDCLSYHLPRPGTNCGIPVLDSNRLHEVFNVSDFFRSILNLQYIKIQRLFFVFFLYFMFYKANSFFLFTNFHEQRFQGALKMSTYLA